MGIMQTELLPIAKAVHKVTGKEFHPVTVGRWRRENRLRGCVKIGKEWYCEPDRVKEMISRDSVGKTREKAGEHK